MFAYSRLEYGIIIIYTRDFKHEYCPPGSLDG